ncbi:MAG: lysylphosphatidylglycerol synthase transmembrane domain-containing protein [Candidatus Omnitrophota bacterium]
MNVLKRVISVLFRVAISIALLVLLFRQVDTGSLFSIIRQADKVLLFLAFLVYFASYIMCLLRWDMLLKTIQIKLLFRRVAVSFCGGIFFNLFLPSSIGGDFVRSVDLASHTKKASQVVATVFLDRLSGYIGLVILSLVSLALGWGLVLDKGILISIGAISFILLVILTVLFNNFAYSRINRMLSSPAAGRIRELITNLHQEIYYFRQHKSVIISNILLSLLIQIIPPLTFYILALSLGLEISMFYFFIFLPIIGAVTLLPVSIGGLGLREATTVILFSQAGVSKDLSLAMSLLSSFFIAVYAAIGGLVYVFGIHRRRLQRS